ncbi:MAG: hypothetical protein ABSF34_02370 [Verrucomicrobiota bacterium]
MPIKALQDVAATDLQNIKGHLKGHLQKNHGHSQCEQAGMNGLPKYLNLTGVVCAVVAAFSFAREAPAKFAYLPGVGVPPLRIEVVTTNEFNYLAFSEALSAVRTNLATAPTINTVNSDNSSATSPSIPKTIANNSPAAANILITTSPETGDDGEKDGRQPNNFAFPSSTASDLLTVTPQMITQYLKPEANETNQLDRPGVVVFVPADMPFMPPTQKTVPESRAIYQSR